MRNSTSGDAKARRMGVLYEMEEQYSSEGIPTRGSPGPAAVTLPPGFSERQSLLAPGIGPDLDVRLDVGARRFFTRRSPIVSQLPSSDYASVRCASLLSPPKRQSHAVTDKVTGMRRLR